MPTFTRTNGDAMIVVAQGNVSVHTESATATQVVSTGIGKHPNFITVSNVATMATATGTGEAVEAILGAVSNYGTILAYQVNTTVLSIAVEGLSANTATVQSAVVALGANVGGTGFDATPALVKDYGLKLATS